GGGALVSSVLVQERRLELALPAGVGWERVARTHRATSVEFQQFGGHCLDRGTSAIAHLPPGAAAQLVEARRWAIAVVRTSTISLELVESIQRHVEAIAALGLEHRSLDRRTCLRDRGAPAVDPGTVNRVH